MSEHRRARRLPWQWTIGAAAVLALALLLPCRGFAAALQVSPTRFEFSLERRFTNYFTVTNNSSEALRIRVITAFVELDADGKMREVTQQPLDLGPWMVFNPRRMTLRPGEKRVVRFSVRAPEHLPGGEYRTVVFFEELPERPDEAAAPNAEIGIHVKLLTRLGITVYGRVGTLAPDVQLREHAVAVHADALELTTLLANAGNAHATFTVKAELLDASGAVQSSTEERLTLQRDQQRRLALRLPRPAAGGYRLHLSAASAEHPWFQTELPVTLEPPPR
jgi:P pilus assembly chaperone PapD